MVGNLTSKSRCVWEQFCSFVNKIGLLFSQYLPHQHFIVIISYYTVSNRIYNLIVESPIAIVIRVLHRV